MAEIATGSAATEHTADSPLAEVVKQAAGLPSEIELQVIRTEMIEYTYPWKGVDVSTQKLHVVLQSTIPEQY